MKFDFHIHSHYSMDTLTKPQSIVKMARKRGVNGIAITDHHSILGGISARERFGEDFLIIIGAEIFTEVGDLLCLFLNEDIKSRKSLEVLDEVKDQGGLIALPHPFHAHNWYRRHTGSLPSPTSCPYQDK